MKCAFIFGILSFSILLLFSCSQRRIKQAENTLPVKQVAKKISITSVGAIEFVRSFSFIQSNFLSEKERDRLFDETSKRNPVKIDNTDEPIRKRLEELGIVKGNELLLNKLKTNYEPSFSFTDLSGQEIKVKLLPDTIFGLTHKINASSELDSCEIKTLLHIGAQSAMFDVVPRCNKELIIFSASYGSNTDFYYGNVFEIKTKV